MEVKSLKLCSMSMCQLESTEPCVNLCGMCPSCVFAPKLPGSTQCLWTVSDDFKRRFLLGLILRCKSVQVLKDVQRMLSVTSWTLFTYGRSRRPTSAQLRSRRSPDGAQRAEPPGPDVRVIWEWFTSSPDSIKSRYLRRLFSLCEVELLRTVANLTSVLLVRLQRGFLQSDVSTCKSSQHDQDSEDPALMVIPGSSTSVSGVSRYRDFICCLPVDLSKRILGLLDEPTLRRCQKVCQYWRRLAGQTLEEIRFRRVFLDQVKTMMKRYGAVHRVSSTYANVVDVLVPVEDDEGGDAHSRVHKGKPFESAYANVRTKTVQMEERNVYCGAHYTEVLLDKEDPHRTVHYRGGPLLATGSRDCAVRLLHVAAETKCVAVMKGHIGAVRAVVLCEEHHLVITAGRDSSIRCWGLRTHQCVTVLSGHSGTVTCLDVHADRLVSGAKDCSVKVWSLQTEKQLERFNFKHPSSVQCVKISAAAVYSSCRQGPIRIWDMENASLLRVIDAHRSSVKCLFFDKWHLLSGDSGGQVKAWSLNAAAKDCLRTFSHPKEVHSLALVYLRVVTGCVDGKIRVFNFLTGDCLRDIAAEASTGRLLSLHFHDDNILVNTTSCVKLIRFGKVFWDSTEATAGGGGDEGPQEGSVADKPAASLRKTPSNDVGGNRTAQTASPTRKTHDCKSKKPERAELLHRAGVPSTPTKCRARAGERRESPKQSVMLSEKATCDRMKKRGLHHPVTRDSLLLRVSAMQRAQCEDEVSINMEHNAKLRDSWGSDPDQQDPKPRSDRRPQAPVTPRPRR